MKSPIEYSSTVEKLPRSCVKINVEVKPEALTKSRAQALATLLSQAELPGFRKGHVPEKVFIERVGEQYVLEEGAESIVNEIYPYIIADHKLPIIGRPKISLTKVVAGNPFEFSIEVAIIPEFKLPDYRAVAKEITSKPQPEFSVTDKEVVAVLEEIQHSLYHREHPEDHSHDHDSAKLAALDDSFAQKVGNFKNLDELKEKIKENLILEKKHKEAEKRRIELVDTLVSKTDVEIPEVLIESELQKLWANFDADIARMGLDLKEYLTRVKKTEEELKKEWYPDAQKRAVFELLISAIATKEKIVADEALVTKEVDALLEQYKGADRNRAQVYVENLHITGKVFELLEGTTDSK
jgi:FKBP-type peptidyl-prolyl cis-trans isomerase (trigger factor)